jgi:hypothetical protein
MILVVSPFVSSQEPVNTAYPVSIFLAREKGGKSNDEQYS